MIINMRKRILLTLTHALKVNFGTINQSLRCGKCASKILMTLASTLCPTALVVLAFFVMALIIGCDKKEEQKSLEPQPPIAVEKDNVVDHEINDAIDDDPVDPQISPMGSDGKVVYVAVMDPLAVENACACIEGFAQRNYKQLSSYLAFSISNSVRVVFCNNITDAISKINRMPDFIIGKKSVIDTEAKDDDYNLNNIAMLTGKGGLTTLTGLVVVRKDDPAKVLSDLKDRKILFGTDDADEKYYAAIKLAQKAGVSITNPQTRTACIISATEVVKGKADAAVISSYALPLMYGCKTIGKGALRVIAETEPVPFVSVYSAGHIGFNDAMKVQHALLGMCRDKGMLKALETKKGFVKPPKTKPKTPLNIKKKS